MLTLSAVVALSGSILGAIPALIVAVALVGAGVRAATARDFAAYSARLDRDERRMAYRRRVFATQKARAASLASLSTFSVDDFALLASWGAAAKPKAPSTIEAQKGLHKMAMLAICNR
jgi:hypothetical protein